MQFGGNTVLHRLTNRIRSKSRTDPFTEARNPSAIFLWSFSDLPDSRADHNPAHGSFSNRVTLPTLPIRMRSVCSCTKPEMGQQHHDHQCAGDPHDGLLAIGWPKSRTVSIITFRLWHHRIIVLVSIAPKVERPLWLRAPAPTGENYRDLKSLIERLRLHTVCESAACPNVGECWNQRTATFMILGNVCTRRCGFCAVQKGAPLPVDFDEPERVAEAVEAMGLKFAVVTSVNRDDREDGGAELFADTIRAIRRRVPGCGVEVLIPDFQGKHEAVEIVMQAAPDVLNHNTETVPRLYRQVRLGARYERSLDVLEYAKKIAPGTPTKSGLMLGLGETSEEVRQVMRDLRVHQVEILTLGQYLRPSPKHLPIVRYVRPEEFAEFRAEGLELGFKHVESGPLVRSSYHASDSVR
jgi:lipoic acid synthetase